MKNRCDAMQAMSSELSTQAQKKLYGCCVVVTAAACSGFVVGAVARRSLSGRRYGAEHRLIPERVEGGRSPEVQVEAAQFAGF